MKSGLDFLQNMLGGQQRPGYQDFVKRYDEGPPSQGYTDKEVSDRFNEVTPHLPPAEFEQSAEQAFARLSPEERAEFGRYLQQRTRERNVNVPDLNGDGIDDRLQDPATLARATREVNEKQPDILGQLLGGKSGTMLDNPIAKAALAGIAAMAARKILTGR